jgi:hypothetical protein
LAGPGAEEAKLAPISADVPTMTSRLVIDVNI